MRKQAVIILSGGMDSTTLLYHLLHQDYQVDALSFNYGQKHKKELDFAIATCKKLNVHHHIVDLQSITSLICNSSLTSEQSVPEGHYSHESMIQTVVPNRNMIMLSIAAGFCISQGIETLAIGVHSGDHAIYPDCRPDFISLFEKTVNSGNYGKIKLYTPFINLDKGDIAIIGKDLGVDYSNTWTCYKGLDEPCGKCGACVERAEALTKARLAIC